MTQRHLEAVGASVNIVPKWNDIDMSRFACNNEIVPSAQYDELVTIAADHDGLITSGQAREAGFADSVLVRLAQRGRLERTARGVYRVPYVPVNRYSQYREAILWAKAHRGPTNVALSHESALAAYGISDASPSAIHLTVPTTARLRRAAPDSIMIHWASLNPEEIALVEGLPLTTIARTVADLLASGGRVDLAKQAVADAKREGFISNAEAQRLRRSIQRYLRGLRAS